MFDLEELRRSVAEESFVKAQKMAVERFGLVHRNEGDMREVDIL